MARLFLYGTLKKGFSNHRRLAGQTFIGEAKTMPNFRLYRTNSFPCMVRDDDGIAVKGEVWEVDDECLRQLDWFEGHPDLFKREFVEIEGDESGGIAAYIFQHDINECKVIGDSWNVGQRV